MQEYIKNQKKSITSLKKDLKYEVDRSTSLSSKNKRIRDELDESRIDFEVWS